MEKLILEGLHIVIIQTFKFQKMCIKVHNGSNISDTSFELFDLENVQDQPE
jgi:cytochrome c peroxidase